MDIRHLNSDELLRDFRLLAAEVECGDHYDPGRRQHVVWLERRVAALYGVRGTGIGLYADDGVPVALHPGENGLDDLGQVYLCKNLRSAPSGAQGGEA